MRILDFAHAISANGLSIVGSGSHNGYGAEAMVVPAMALQGRMQLTPGWPQ